MALQVDDRADQLRAEFPGALRAGQVIGHYQPQVDLATGRVVAAELLARWDHPDLGTLPPASFIELAEELGLMRELTLEMVRQGLAQHRGWAAAGWTVPVSVNVGPSCVTDPGFPAEVLQLLAEQQVPGPMLVLEVSEETGTTAASTRFFAQLAEAGVQVSLDDFGTGYASLESLGGWPINELKLDRSIVRPITSSASFRTIVRTTIDLAHQLGARVVAEGVESAAIAGELRALGCDTGQGFYLGRPMSAADFTRWLSEPGRAARWQNVPVPAPRRPVTSGPEPGGPGRARPGGGRATAAAAWLRGAVAQPGGASAAAAVALLAAYGLWQLFRWGGREHQALIGDLAFAPITGLAALLAWRASRRADLARGTRRGWLLLSVSLSLYLAGGLLQLGYENILHQRAYPTWADAAYLGCYAVSCAGLLAFPARRRSRPERIRMLLDTGTVFCVGAILIWYIALGPAVAAGPRFDLADLVTYAYPVGDLLVLFATLTVLWRGAPRESVTALRVFAIAMLVNIASDLAYDWVAAHSGYLGGDPVDLLRMAAITIASLAAVCQLRSPADHGATGPAPWPAATRPTPAPYLAVVVSYLVLLVAGLREVSFDPLGGIVLGAVLLSLLVTARQFVTLRDYARLASRYRDLAAIDGVTGLFNRRHFMETAEAAFAHAQRLGQPFTALMMDVDNFKQINDQYGHVAGDQVLAKLADACRQHTRPDDIVGRFGGDEFVIMVPGITSLRAIQLAEQLTRPAPGGGGAGGGGAGGPLDYRVSVGVAQCPPGGDLSVLLMHADLAMYQAKEAGGGTWRIFDDAARAEPADGLEPSASS